MPGLGWSPYTNINSKIMENYVKLWLSCLEVRHMYCWMMLINLEYIIQNGVHMMTP